MGLSIRAYAQHRGVSHTAVAKAIKAGRISVEPDGKIDPAKADAQWARNTLPSQNLNTGTPKPATKVATPPVSTPVSTAAVANRELQPPLETRAAAPDYQPAAPSAKPTPRAWPNSISKNARASCSTPTR